MNNGTFTKAMPSSSATRTGRSTALFENRPWNVNSKYKKICEIHSQKQMSTGNMLPLAQYKYVSSPKVVDQIMTRDIVKYELREKQKDLPKKEKKNWRNQPNCLHNNKQFVGNWEKRYPGRTSSRRRNWMLDRHGLTTPLLTHSYAAGFGAGEYCFHVSKNRIYVNCRQNHRQIHLITGTRDLFGCGSMRAHSMWNNVSAFELNVVGIEDICSVLLPVLHKMNFVTIKELEKILFCNRAVAFKRGVDRNLIQQNFGSTMQKKLQSIDSARRIPEVERRFVVGTQDSDGTCSQKDKYRKLEWGQKDAYLLEVIKAHFNGKGIMHFNTYHNCWHYRLKYEENLDAILHLYSKCMPLRTDLVFKHHYLLHAGFGDCDPIRKLPEYVPRGVLQLYRLKNTGTVLPDQLLDVQETYYPLELQLYYQDIYKNVYSKYNIPAQLQPFRNKSSFHFLFIYFIF